MQGEHAACNATPVLAPAGGMPQGTASPTMRRKTAACCAAPTRVQEAHAGMMHAPAPTTCGAGAQTLTGPKALQRLQSRSGVSAACAMRTCCLGCFAAVAACTLACAAGRLALCVPRVAPLARACAAAPAPAPLLVDAPLASASATPAAPAPRRPRLRPTCSGLARGSSTSSSLLMASSRGCCGSAWSRKQWHRPLRPEGRVRNKGALLAARLPGRCLGIRWRSASLT